jgi:phosphate-selective porin OprO/OprP
MTPLTYDQFAIRNIWLPTPERSLFTTNLGLNRQVGGMAWGFLFDKRLDYAAGVFTGVRNSFEDLNNAKDFIGYLNGRPFQNSKSLGFLRDWNIGGSVAWGVQDQPAVPRAFRIGAVAPTNADQAGLAAAPFLTLNNDVSERGERLLGSVHSAYYYKGLSVIGEWQYGHGGYASSTRPTPVQVPFSAFYVTLGYFLTGEHMERRAMVKPLRPVFPTTKGDRRGIGAWELVGSYNDLRLGRQVFDAGFADKNLWSNQADTTEVGLNWYLNEYLKVYMFWLHGEFGDPVSYRPGGLQKTADMFWMRFQLFF